AVGIELGEGLAPRPEYLLGLDSAVLVLVRPREAPLLAVLGGRFGRGQAGPGHRGTGGARLRRIGQARPLLRTRLPQQESTGQKQKAGRRPGEKSCHRASPHWEIRLPPCSASARLMSTIEGIAP